MLRSLSPSTVFVTAIVSLSEPRIGARRPMIELRAMEGLHWRQVRAAALRVMANAEEMSEQEMWVVTLTRADATTVVLHLEPAILGEERELARGQKMLQTLAQRVTP